tara:strand:- start:2199 stop:2477 length:279 start_codon:yes stop_codon:yes gene_type:complete
MKNFTKTTLALLTASVMATAAFADNDTPSERLQSAKGGVEALAVTLENMGASVDTNVDLNGANTFDQKAAVYTEKHTELQKQFDSLNLQSAE